MRILCMPQAFKGTLKARDAAEAMMEGALRAVPNADAQGLPVADGGDDTLDVLVDATGGTRLLTEEVWDPRGRPIMAEWGVLGDRETAVIEMSLASGLRLLKHNERDPRHTSTFGTGQLIKTAIDAGYRKIVVGVGGSATVDAGVGAARALGIHFRDASGHEVPAGGAHLSRVHSIDFRDMDPRLKDCVILMACDVDMPLCGPDGAWRFSAQKGASPAVTEELMISMEHFGKVVNELLRVDLRSMPLAGPGGGISGGLHALLGARLERGSDLVLETLKVDQPIQESDLVIIGEGRLDAHSFKGKGPGAVAHRARKAGVPVVAVVGQLGEDVGDVLQHGIVEVETLMSHARSEDDACTRARELVAIATERVVARHVRTRMAASEPPPGRSV